MRLLRIVTNTEEERYFIMTTTDGAPLAFRNAQAWRTWLQKNYAYQEGIWMRLYKKNSGIASITHAEALDQALCFGWIDGQGKKLDEASWMIKFTPRRQKSIWSKRNKANVERLIKARLMTVHGLREVDRAKQDGRWDAAYDSQKYMVIPEDFLHALSKHQEAERFFMTLNKTNLYAIAWRLQTAKNADTRKKRIASLIESLKQRKTFH